MGTMNTGPNVFKKIRYSLVPYADITAGQITNSIVGDKDKMPRSSRGTDLVKVQYLSTNRSNYTDYEVYDESISIYSNPAFNTGYNSLSFKSSDLTITNDVGLEIGQLDITAGGTGYASGTLTATGGGGNGFKGVYTVDGSGTIDVVNILNRGIGYTSAPTIVISSGAGSNGVITPHLVEPIIVEDDPLYEDYTKTTPCYTINLAQEYQPVLTFGIDNTNIPIMGAGVVDTDFLIISGTSVRGRSPAEVLGDIGAQASLTFGLSSGNALKSEEALTTNDILLAGSSNIKGRTYAELKSDLSLNNVTNNAQLPLAGGTMSGDVDFGDNDITNIASLDFGGTSIGAFQDEDNMASDSATAVCSQQSIKAYTDSHIKYSESVYFYFAEETTNRTYFRDADDTNYPMKWDAYDTESDTVVGNTISLASATYSAGVAVPYASKLKGVRWIGYSGMNYDQVVHLQVWTGTIPDDSTALVTATLRDSISLTDYKRKGINQYTALDVALSAGDMIYPAFKYDSGTSVLYYGSVSFMFERA